MDSYSVEQFKSGRKENSQMILRRTVFNDLFRCIIFTSMLIMAGWTITPIYSARAETVETILRIHGSNTMGPHLVADLAQQYLKVRGADSVIRTGEMSGTKINVTGMFPNEDMIRTIEITANGTDAGFKTFKVGKCDIVMASRRIAPAEAGDLAAFGDMTDVACEHVFALDGVAVVMHPDNNTITTANLDLLADIFSGKITNWSRIGGPDAPIHLHARDENSGTHDIFKQVVLENSTLSPRAVRWDTNDGLSDAVRNDLYAIGYCGLPFVKTNKVLKISDGSLPAAPTRLSVGTEDYPLTRRLYLYTPAEPENTDTMNFVAFALDKSEPFIIRHKFVPLTITAEPWPVEMIKTIDQVAALNRYIDAVSGHKRLSTNYRFNRGNFKLDSRGMRDLERMETFLEENSFDEVILAGFSDSRGDYQQNYMLSCRRAETIRLAFEARGIHVERALCVGEEVPVASNKTLTGREKNRRVEVWVK